MLKFFNWLPRILAIIYILFISVFALDAFQQGEPLLKNILAFVIHLVPSLLLTFCLIIATQRKFIGGILYLAIFTLFTLHYGTFNELSLFLLISLPPLLVGIAFLISYYIDKREESKEIG